MLVTGLLEPQIQKIPTPEAAGSNRQWRERWQPLLRQGRIGFVTDRPKCVLQGAVQAIEHRVFAAYH